MPSQKTEVELALVDDGARDNQEPLPVGRRAQSQEQASGRPPAWFFWGVLPGAIGLLVVLVTVIVLALGKQRPTESIVGIWVDSQGRRPGQIAFNQDGTADLGGSDPSLRFVKYKFLDDNTIHITSMLEPHITFQLRVSFASRDELQLSGREGMGTLKRVR